MRFVLDDQTQMFHMVSASPSLDSWTKIPVLDDAMQNGAHDLLVQPIVNVIEQVIEKLFIDLGHFLLHAAAPVCVILCTIFILGSILGVDKAPKRALICGIIASMGYGMGWSNT